MENLCFVETLEPRVAPASIVNGAIVFNDLDGDVVTVKASKGSLSLSDAQFAAGAQPGTEQLQVLTLGSAFQGTNLTITASPTATGGDGVVNIGYVNATGIDLGVVKISGDLAAIDAGDSIRTPALKSLSVLSLGALGTSTGAPDLSSNILGPVGSIKVVSDIFAASIFVSGQEFGTVASVFIGGSIFGGSITNSGGIYAQGAISKVFLGGALVGGSGTFSGALAADSFGSVTISRSILGGLYVDPSQTAQSSGYVYAAKSIGLAKVYGTIFGGSGTNSGLVYAGEKINAMGVSGGLIGGSGSQSGNIIGAKGIGVLAIAGGLVGGSAQLSGAIQAPTGASIGTLLIGENIAGGDGVNAGSVLVSGNLGTLTIAGSLEGGSGDGAGRVFAGGTLLKGRIGHNVLGGNSDNSTPLLDSGYVFADRIASLTIGGSLIAGHDGGGGLANSGAIRAGHDIGTVIIKGDFVGNSTMRALISAVGQVTPSSTGDMAIKEIAISGDTNLAEILAGYSADVGAGPRGTPVNADAQIGMVKVGGNMFATNIVAGVSAGADLRFGDATDVAISGGTDRAGLTSKIGSVIVGGQAIGTIANDSFHFGIVAQEIGSVKIAGTVAIPLHGGASNDLAPGRALGFTTGTSLADGFDFHILEVA